ncbi:MAG: DUF4367 domain-containing protein [bacterium]|nr:DUF4367 domain-containing protein [bacterium]
MGKHLNTIEINGKRYNAATGKLIAGHQPGAVSAPQLKATSGPQAIDGVVSRSNQVKNPHRALERSKTLMRHAVKKPHNSISGAALKAVSTIPSQDFSMAKPILKRPSTLAHPTDAAREVRASKVKQSRLVSKFNDSGHQSRSDQIHPMPVRPAPAHAEHKEELSHHAGSHSVIEKGLKSAQSHQQKYKAPAKKTRTKTAKRARLASMGASSLAVLLLVGFFAYQNIPNFAMRYATTRAGVNASLPGYKPAGFALNSHIRYNPGQITVEFKSNTDDRAFTITQRESAWNSDTLRQNYVASASDQVHTYEDKGQTIYLYGGSNATWVNGGLWFDIKGDSQLNSDQLIRIATSM